MTVREQIDAAARCAAERRFDDAKAAYLSALGIEPGNADALTGLGVLLARAGRLTDARGVLEAAVRIHPRHADAYRFLVAVLSDLGDETAANAYSAREFALRPVHSLPFAGTGRPVRLLLLVAAASVNTRTARFCDARLFETTTVAVEFIGAGTPLPPHDVIFNAIGEAEAGAAMAAAARVAARSDRPVLNRPAVIGATNRVDNAARLRALPGVITARTRRIARSEARNPALAAELGWPLLLRVPGHHTGDYFERVDGAAGIDAALASLPGAEFIAMSFIDARDATGRYRKFRMMIVDGALYPLHAAIGANWKLHFFSGSHDDAERALDAAFLADPQAVIGAPAMSALHAIAGVLRLDYGGIDFGIDAAGNVLVFEANATMTVPAPDPDARFAYRTPALGRVTDAVMEMFISAARAGARAGHHVASVSSGNRARAWETPVL